MTLSMTGFALCREDTAPGELIWEIRAVNQRFLDLTVRLPEEFRALEETVRKQLKSRIARGKVECYLKYVPNPTQAINVNKVMVKTLMEACDDVSVLQPKLHAFTALDVLRWPGTLQTEQASLVELKPVVMQLLENTLDAFIQSRQREGTGLAEVMQLRCEKLAELTEQAKIAIPEAMAALKQKILARIEEVAISVESDRLEQELVFWFQKMDVDEELDRLTVHLQEVSSILKKEEPVGRRLDFIVQEMNREANTLGSKAANTALTQIAVNMKVLIEQIREQVQNVE